MNFFGLLWVVSAISSFLSPQNTPKVLEYLSKAIPNQAFALINEVAHPFAAKHQLHSLGRISNKPIASVAVPGAASELTPRSGRPSFISARQFIGASFRLQPADPHPPPLSMLLASHSISSSPSTALSTGGSSLQSADALLGVSLPVQSLFAKELSNPISQVVDSVFRWSDGIRQAFGFTTPLVTIVQAHNPCLASAGSEFLSGWQYFSKPQTRTLKLGECTGLWQHDATQPKPVETVFQVQVKGQVVAEVPTEDQAEAIARRIRQVLQNSHFNPYQLFPAIVDGMPAGKAGDELLFWIEPELEILLDRNADLLAIAWINNLRSALNVPPIPLAEAQSQMHGLIPTQRRIQGTASWYGPYFHGRITATGEVFDQHALTAAHPSLPFNTYLRVTNLHTGNMVIVRINDRGPYFEDRSLDLSLEAARCLGSEVSGVVPYEAVIMERSEIAQYRSKAPDAVQTDTAQQIWAKRPE